MPEARRSPHAWAWPVTGIAAAILLLGALALFLPYATRKRPLVAGVPAPPLSLGRGQFASNPVARQLVVRAHGQACMDNVTIEPQAGLVEFGVEPANGGSSGGPPVEVAFRAPGYRASGEVPAGYLGASRVAVSFTAPEHAVIGTACFIDKGSSAIVLEGTYQAETTYRSLTTVNGKHVGGQVALTFLGEQRRRLIDRLGEVFGHVSVLTDRLVPVWLVWLLAVLVVLGVPFCVLGALWFALDADQAAVRSEATAG